MFIRHFESGGAFLDFDTAKVRAYEQQFNAAKAVWSGQKFIHTGRVLQAALSCERAFQSS